jgi:hypothetical protein
MKKLILIIFIVVIVSAAIAHWYFSDRGRFTTAAVFTDLGRSVSSNDLVSKEDPAAILRFDPSFKHLGGQKFILYGVADTEQHFFIKTTNENKLKSVYWIQYEAYLPDNSQTYDYDDSPLRVNLGDYEFYTDTDVVEFDPDRKRKSGTDGAMARQFLASKGYTFPKDFAYARLVYLTDESRRKELMIIFIDDLAAYGFTAAELKDGGAMAEHWNAVEHGHLERIRTTLDVLPLHATD